MKRKLDTTGILDSSTDQFPAYVRAYVPTPQTNEIKKSGPKRNAAPASAWELIFDTETTIGAGQSLRFGAYQLRKAGVLHETGLFYEPAIITPTEFEKLESYACNRGLPLLTRDQFVDTVFYQKAYERRATIIGMNLPFDLSRLALRHGPARGRMKGGFTFQLSTNPKLARIQIKHLSSRAAFIRFAGAPRRLTSRGSAKRGVFTPTRRGSFVDIKTLSAALFGHPFSLESLSNFLKTATRKSSSSDHGEHLNEKYLDYAVRDVQATWECYEAVTRKFAEHGLTQTDAARVFSEASIGKAYLREMCIRPLLQMQPDIPPEIFGITWSSYFGGRTETRWRRTMKQVLCCDFLSMYPTVCTLMRLWSFMTATGLDWVDTTADTQALLDQVCISDLQNQSFWTQLHTLVQLKPDGDILPLRTRYNGKSCTIGLNHVTSETPLWYTLADVVASKLLSRRIPQIEKALTFKPRAPQDGLRSIEIAGQTLDPAADDLFRRIIDVRTDIKRRLKAAAEDERERLNSDQLALKLLANSTSYGIFAEVNVADLDTPDTRPCFGPSGQPFDLQTNKSEEPGPFFNPLMATLITGGARLMLAMAEALATAAGLDWAFCDTDSMAFAKPDGMSSDDFLKKARGIASTFDTLNPYQTPGPLLKIEDTNFGIGEAQMRPLYAFCVSSKRYVLFNLADDGTPIIRKASAHGLGHLRAPYEPDDAPVSVPAPAVSRDEICVERWQYDLWFQIIKAALAGNSAEVDHSYHPGLSLPAMSRYGATTPEILRWLKGYNGGRNYQDQVKPFGFLSAFYAVQIPGSIEGGVRSARRSRSVAKPIAPFSKDPKHAARSTFDRESGEPIEIAALKSYLMELAQYHLSPEPKFQNGDFLDSGRTERRWTRVSSINHIGKEANNLEKQFFLGVEDGEQIEYGGVVNDGLVNRIDELCKLFGEREVARRAVMSRMSLRKARRDFYSINVHLRQRLRRM